MNIMYIIDDLLIGGAQKVLLNTIKGINKKKYKILVISLFDGEGMQNQIEAAGAQVIFLHMAHKYDVVSFIKLIRIIKKNNISIVHTHLALANFIGRLAAKLAGVKIIIATIHNYFYHQKILNLLIDKTMYHFSSIIICVSEDLKKWYISKAKVNGVKLITIHNSIDLNEFNFSADKQNTRKNFGIHNENIILGNIQPIRKANNQRLLISAVAKILKTHNNIKLLVVGDGPEKINLEKFVIRLGLQNNIVFLGFKRNLSEIYSVIDIFVSCPLYESFGMVILEAMAMKKPVISTRVGGIPEVVLENESAVLVESENVNELSSAIISLIEDKDKQNYMGLIGRKRAEKLFSLETIGNKIDALYEKQLSQIEHAENPF